MNSLLYLLMVIPQPFEYRQLQWSDYKGIPEHHSWAATTITTLELTEENTDGIYTFGVKCYFVPGESWTTTESSAKLIHEQTHFDISYLYYLKAIRTLLPYQGTSKRKEAMVAYQKLCKQWQSTERLFDIRTNHSLDISAEKIWERSIKKQIKELE
jgi:hypothetical protein